MFNRSTLTLEIRPICKTRLALDSLERYRETVAGGRGARARADLCYLSVVGSEVAENGVEFHPLL